MKLDFEIRDIDTCTHIHIERLALMGEKLVLIHGGRCSNNAGPSGGEIDHLSEISIKERRKRDASE